MKKRILSLLFALLLLLGTIPFASAQEGDALGYADRLNTLGLVSGTTSGEYSLNSPATRAQAAVLLVRLAGAESDAAREDAYSGYRDVPAWAADAVHYAVRQGWIDGAVSSLDFHPDQAVTANEWFTALLRMLGYSDKNGDFSPEGAATFAQHIGLAARSFTGSLSRADLFESMENALTFSYKGSETTVLDHLLETGSVTRAAANALGYLRQELTPRQVADRLTAAVFCLDGYEKQIEVDALDPVTNASGFFISPDGLAVTNYHSIQDANYATATLSTGERYPVERVVYYDVDIDIAVIQVSKTALDHTTTSAFAYLEIAPSGSENVRPGDTVYTIGNPLGLGLAVSSGLISATDRVVERYALPCLMNTADISQGSSGGVLLNALGQAIGVTTGAFTYGNNMYLAVPIDPVLTADLTAQGWTLQEVRARNN